MGLLETVRAFFSPVIRLKRDPVPLLILSGTFDERKEESLKAVFRQLEEGSVELLVLNVSKAKFVGAHIVGELIAHLTELKNRNVRVKIVAGPEYEIKHGWWLHSTQLNEVLFEIYQDQNQAIKSASQPNELTVPTQALQNPNEAVMDFMGQRAFAMRLLAEFARTPGNIFVSPLSVWYLLALLFPGTRGESREILGSVLGLPAEHNDTGWIPELRKFTCRLGMGKAAPASRQEAQRQRVLLSKTGRRGQKTYTKFDLAIANALWVQKGYSIRAEYLDQVVAALGARSEELDFAGNPIAACGAVNQWARDSTAGKIDQILNPGGLPALTRLILTNATYFKAAWAKTFESAIPGVFPFKLLNGAEINVPMMSQRRAFPYFERDGLQIVELPYAGVHLSMVIVLPPLIRDFDAALTPDTFEQLLSSLDHVSHVWLWMPKFKVSSDMNLMPSLSAMGLEVLFGESADLGGISTERGVHIDQVKQVSWVRVDEYGTEAAAVSVGYTIGGGEYMPPIRAIMIVNRPFWFFIRDYDSGSILFAGRVLDPS